MGVAATLARVATLPKCIPDEKLVYVTLRNIIKGGHTRICNVKTVCNFISKQQDAPDIKHLIQRHTLEDMCQMTKKLLEDHIFESRLQAELCFPNVFKLSSEKKTKPSVPKQATVKAQNAAAQAPLNGHGKKAEPPADIVTNDENAVVHNPNVRRQMEPETHASTLKKVAQSPIITTQAYQAKSKAPVNTITNGETDAVHLPAVLEAKHWDCAEAAELDLWAKVFVQHQDKLPPSSTSKLVKPLPSLLQSLANLRHIAVHRLRLPAHDILQFFLDAEALVKIFHDDDTLSTISQMRQHVQTSIRSLARNKKTLDTRMVATRNQFSELKAEFNREEKAALHGIMGEDRGYTRVIAEKLGWAIGARIVGTEEKDLVGMVLLSGRLWASW